MSNPQQVTPRHETLTEYLSCIGAEADASDGIMALWNQRASLNEEIAQAETALDEVRQRREAAQNELAKLLDANRKSSEQQPPATVARGAFATG